MGIETVAAAIGAASSLKGLFGGSERESGVDPSRMQAMADPNAAYRSQWASMLNNLLMNPSSVTSSPGYQFRLNQGTEAVNRGMAASGQLQSGAEQIALQKMGQGMASDEWYKQLQMLSGLVGGSAGGGAEAYMGALRNQQGRSDLNWQGLSQATGALANLYGGGSNSSSSGNWGTGWQTTNVNTAPADTSYI